MEPIITICGFRQIFGHKQLKIMLLDYLMNLFMQRLGVVEIAQQHVQQEQKDYEIWLWHI